MPFEAIKAAKKDNGFWPTLDETKDGLQKAPNFKYDRANQIGYTTKVGVFLNTNARARCNGSAYPFPARFEGIHQRSKETAFGRSFCLRVERKTRRNGRWLFASNSAIRLPLQRFASVATSRADRRLPAPGQEVQHRRLDQEPHSHARRFQAGPSFQTQSAHP